MSAARLREALNRAHERLEQADLRGSAFKQVRAAASEYEDQRPAGLLDRLPVWHGEEILLLPVAQIGRWALGSSLAFCRRRDEGDPRS